MWQRRSLPEQGGRVRSHGTRGSIGALLCREAGVRSHGTCGSARALPSKKASSRAMGHVVAPEPSRAGRRGPELWDMW
jgi:hypothetical protein